MSISAAVCCLRWRLFCRAANSVAQAITRQITLVVPYSAGGGTDTVARLIGNQMSRSLGRPVVIENVVGAGGTLANERVARSEPDGATVLINHVGLLAAPSLFTNLRYDTNVLRCRRPRQQRADAAGRPQDDSRARPEAIRRLDQVERRRGQFRAWRRRHQQPSLRGHDGQRARLQADLRGLSRLGAGDHRPACRPDRSAVGPGDQRDPAGAAGHAARHRHYLDRAARAS